MICFVIGMFKNCRNHPKKYYLCQKSAKSGSARIWKCVLTLPSSEYLCNQGPNGFQNCGKLLVKKEPARGHCCPMLNVTANSKVKLHILGKAKWLTIFLNHLSIQWLKYNILHQCFAQIFFLKNKLYIAIVFYTATFGT